jgi:hypothetical protein
MSNEKYVPMFLSWAKSFEEEKLEFEHLISCAPSDIDLLKKQYKLLLEYCNE